MISDQGKDRIEDAGAALLEAAVSIVPIIGGPTAVIINRVLGSATRRRQEQILEDLARDISRLEEAGQAINLDQLAESDEFMAALHVALRVSQETASEAKRKMLRSALINGYILETPSERDVLFDLVKSIEPDDVVILAILRDLMVGRSQMLEDSAYAITRAAPGSTYKVGDVARRVGGLVQKGLANRSEKSSVRTVPVARTRRSSFDAPTARDEVSVRVFHNVTPLGEELLSFVADPLEETP